MSISRKPIVEEISLDSWPNNSCAEHVAKLNATKKSNVIVRLDLNNVSRESVRPLGKSCRLAVVLKEIGSRIYGTVKARPVKFGRGRGNLPVCHRLPGSKRSGDERNDCRKKER
jgi:putative transposon-encoded protein